MRIREPRARHLTKAFLSLDNLTHNVRLLQMAVGQASLWPVLKANAYGHDALIVAPHLVRLGYTTFCVADVDEAIALAEAGVSAVAQPGGSKKDGEVISAADELGMTMVFTAHRHFRH